MIKVLIADDVDRIRLGLAMRLRLEPDIQVAGEAASSRAALELVDTLAPDVVLLNLQLKPSDWLGTLDALQALASKSAVIAFSLHHDEKVWREALAAGALAIHALGDVDGALPELIRQVAAVARDGVPDSGG